MAKPVAFLPNPKHKNTSVFRASNDSEKLQQVWQSTSTGERTLKGIAIFKAIHVRAANLDVIAAEPPPAHANIEQWPWIEDPDLQRAKQLEHAQKIAQFADVIKF